jgi:hypothetical protein
LFFFLRVSFPVPFSCCHATGAPRAPTPHPHTCSVTLHLRPSTVQDPC